MISSSFETLHRWKGQIKNTKCTFVWCHLNRYQRSYWLLWDVFFLVEKVDVNSKFCSKRKCKQFLFDFSIQCFLENLIMALARWLLFVRWNGICFSIWIDLFAVRTNSNIDWRYIMWDFQCFFVCVYVEMKCQKASLVPLNVTIILIRKLHNFCIQQALCLFRLLVYFNPIVRIRLPGVVTRAQQ